MCLYLIGRCNVEDESNYFLPVKCVYCKLFTTVVECFTAYSGLNHLRTAQQVIDRNQLKLKLTKLNIKILLIIGKRKQCGRLQLTNKTTT